MNVFGPNRRPSRVFDIDQENEIERSISVIWPKQLVGAAIIFVCIAAIAVVAVVVATVGAVAVTSVEAVVVVLLLQLLLLLLLLLLL